MRRALSPAVGVDVPAAINLTGTLLKYLSLTAALPAAVAVGYDEPVWPFVAAGAIAGGTGIAMEVLTRGHEDAGIREGFLVVSLTWLLAAAYGALPYLFSGEDQLANPIDAYFEAMSGFTTTGASILTAIPELDHSVLIWRQFTQWLGGMGIIVLFLAVLPRLRVGGRQLLESELPGPEIEPLAASIRDTARRLWLLYIGLTAAEAVLLAVLGWTGVDDRMSVFNAASHAFTTLPTGGFSPEARSIEEFAAATQWVIIAFMVIAGANFALTYAALVRGRFRPLVRDEELRLYLFLLGLGAAVLFFEIWTEELYGASESVRHAVFHAVSTMTTTGYASTDSNEWTSLALVVVVALMFAGGSAGSTGGGVKVVRHLLIGRLLRRELDQTVHPELVAPIRLNVRVVDERTLRAVLAFVLLYVGLFAVGTLLIVADASRTGLDLRVIDAIAASATTIGNVGPAFGPAGPMGSFDPFSDFSKGVMIVLMWLGRLEIIPVAVLLTRAYWRA
ncbi:MAG: TrkH family potassium uptake protein [Thermoleophilia bacterium]|nr:TrkH family potassium uptake protein [Thermoleophilia bacterium]